MRRNLSVKLLELVYCAISLTAAECGGIDAMIGEAVAGPSGAARSSESRATSRT